MQGEGGSSILPSSTNKKKGNLEMSHRTLALFFEREFKFVNDEGVEESLIVEWEVGGYGSIYNLTSDQVIAVLYDGDNDELVSFAIAKCSRHDEFDTAKGMKLALAKALKGVLESRSERAQIWKQFRELESFIWDFELSTDVAAQLKKSEKGE